MIVLYAENLRTGKVVELGTFKDLEEVNYNLENNLEWDENDNPYDWNFFTMAEISSEEELEKYIDECDFDPYAGCYTYMTIEEQGLTSPYFCGIIAAGARSRAPELPLYHTASNLSSKNIEKIVQNFSPDFVHFFCK